jgi:hypothetical protein
MTHADEEHVFASNNFSSALHLCPDQTRCKYDARQTSGTDQSCAENDAAEKNENATSSVLKLHVESQHEQHELHAVV